MKLLTVKELCGVFSISRSTLGRWRRFGSFPKGRQLSPGIIRWVEEDVLAWIELNSRKDVIVSKN